MTTEELALNLITHSDTEPSCINAEQAERIISLLDKSEPLPADLTPKTLTDAWNTLILFDLPDEIWENWKNIKGDAHMKKYTIKPEYLDLWEGGDEPSDPNRIITADELERFAAEWDTTVDELLDQLVEITDYGITLLTAPFGAALFLCLSLCQIRSFLNRLYTFFCPSPVPFPFLFHCRVKIYLSKSSVCGILLLQNHT